ncbi:MAG: CDP-alcohol phosphatidyltransferase family protein [Lachnospiraceae bacterium]|nr:CDP-alcohol phosphatidyltransferase family protein [Lachnospiraceae bacterium]
MKEARPDQIWTIPNVLTMIRLALIPLYWALMVKGQTYQALAVYVAASLTDLADGYIARKYHQITNFGKLMDPVADKVMVLSVMLSMVLPLGGREPVLPWAPFIILLSKEALMILGGAFMLKKGIVVYALKIGKIAQLIMVLSLIASFFHEQFVLCLLGCLLGLSSLIWLYAGSPLQLVLSGAFFVLYLLGSVAAVIVNGRMKLMELFASKE